MNARYQLAGWLTFLVCSLFFLGAGIASGNAWTIGGGVTFLIGVLLFLIPFIRGGGQP